MYNYEDVKLDCLTPRPTVPVRTAADECRVNLSTAKPFGQFVPLQSLNCGRSTCKSLKSLFIMIMPVSPTALLTLKLQPEGKGRDE